MAVVTFADTDPTSWKENCGELFSSIRKDVSFDELSSQVREHRVPDRAEAVKRDGADGVEPLHGKKGLQTFERGLPSQQWQSQTPP
jgi:hypothetical protein